MAKKSKMTHTSSLPGLIEGISEAMTSSNVHHVLLTAGISDWKIDGLTLVNADPSPSADAAQRCRMVLGPDGQWHIECD